MESTANHTITLAKELTTAVTDQIRGGIKRSVGAAAYGLSAAIGIGVVFGLSYAIAQSGRPKY